MHEVMQQFRNYLKSPIVKNSSWLFFDKIIRLIFGLIITAWMARYFGPEKFGILSFALAYVSLFGVIVSFGSDGIIVRDLVASPGRASEIIAAGLILRVIGAISAVTLILISLYISEPDESKYVVLIISIGLIFQAFDISELWFQSIVRSKFTVIARLSSFCLFLAVKSILILNSSPLIYFAYATVAEIALGTSILFVLFLLKSRIVCPKFNIDDIFTLAKESTPYIISGVAIMIYMRIDQVMLSKMANNHETGLYSAALKFSEIWYLIPSVIVSTMSPMLAKQFSSSKDDYFKTLQQMTSILTRTAIVLSIVITILSDLIITLLFGIEYLAAADILVIHIWSSVFVFCGLSVSPWVIHQRVSFIAIWPPIFGAVINIILNFLLIPYYGAIGCAIATLIAYAISSWLANSFFKISRPIFKLQTKALTGIEFK